MGINIWPNITHETISKIKNLKLYNGRRIITNCVGTTYHESIINCSTHCDWYSKF